MDDELSFQEDLGVDAGPYDGASVNVSELEWYVWATPELLRKIELFGGSVGRGDTAWAEEVTLPEESN